jgi:hypothetical protein
MNESRDGFIRQAIEDGKTRDTLILQKINASHRVAFSEKFPGQTEHLLRLLCERLQFVLDKRDGVDPAVIESWRATPQELEALSSALFNMYLIHKDLKESNANK